MGYDVTDLALKVFGKDKKAEDKPADHEERHNYYRELSDRQAKGEKLDPEDAKWLAEAKKTIDKWAADKQAYYKQANHTVSDADLKKWDGYNREHYEQFVSQNKPAHLEVGPVKVDPVTLNPVELNAKPAPQLEVGKATVQPISNRDRAGAMAVQNLEALTKGGAPTPVLNGYYRSMTKPVVDLSETQAMERHYAQNPPTIRNAERLPSDVSQQDTDPFADDVLQRDYGEHLKAVDENNGKYPAGYFKGMSPEKKENIKAGVMELMRRRRGIRT